MTTRLLIGYSLLVLMVAGAAFSVWWTIRNSAHNTRRRERRERRARYRAVLAHDEASDEDAATTD